MNIFQQLDHYFDSNPVKTFLKLPVSIQRLFAQSGIAFAKIQIGLLESHSNHGTEPYSCSVNRSTFSSSRRHIDDDVEKLSRRQQTSDLSYDRLHYVTYITCTTLARMVCRACTIVVHIMIIIRFCQRIY